MTKFFNSPFTIAFLIIQILASEPLFAEPPLKVGIALPLTGIVAEMGEAVRKGVELFAAENPDSGLQFIFEDHQYDGKATVSTIHKLVDYDKVDVLVVWGNTPAGAAAPVAEKKEIPTIVMSMNPDGQGRKHVVSMGSRNEALIRQVSLYFRSVNARKPGAVYIDIGSVLEGVNLLDGELNGNLTKKLVASDEQDFKSIILSLRQQKVDAIMLMLMPNQAVTFSRQALALNFDVPLIGGDIFSDLQLLKKLGTRQVAFVCGSVRPDFIRLLESRFGHSNYFFESATGYSVAGILRQVGRVSLLKDRLRELTLGPSPINGLRISEDASYGLHITNDAAVYTLESGQLSGITLGE